MIHSSVPAALLGAWRLVSLQIRMEDTGELIDLYGDKPSGTAIFSPEGRVAFVIGASDRQPPQGDSDIPALFQRMMAYAGSFTVSDDILQTTVDVAWHPAWEGSQQPRRF